jgi:hypothetical protein
MTLMWTKLNESQNDAAESSVRPLCQDENEIGPAV